MEKGKFITVEGVDGAGKSTQVAVIEKALTDRGIDLVRTREPGGPRAAEKIRELLLTEPMSPKCELMLMFAAREENLDKIIRPALAKGQWVICDRFTDASYAYQGYGRGRSIEEIRTLENFVHPDLKPDLTVLFDVPTEVGRGPGLSRKLDRFEKESQDFHCRVREGYLRMAKAEPERFYVVDGTQTPEQISAQLREVFAQWK